MKTCEFLIFTTNQKNYFVAFSMILGYLCFT